MGKGDKRSRRGKIFAGSFGKTRQKPKKSVIISEPKAASEAPVKKPRAAVKVKKSEAEAPPVERTEMNESAESTKAADAEVAAENAEPAGAATVE